MSMTEKKNNWPVGAAYVCTMVNDALVHELRDKRAVAIKLGGYGTGLYEGRSTAWMGGATWCGHKAYFDTAILHRRTIWSRQLTQGAGNEY